MNSNFSTPRLLLAILCSLLGLCGNALLAQASPLNDLSQLPTIESPSNTFTLPRALPVIDVNQKKQLLIGMENGQLRIAFPNMPEAEAIVPIQGVMLNIETPATYNRMLHDALVGDYQSTLTGLKPIAEPMARFLVISPDKSNFQTIFLRYYEALVLAGDLEDAVALSRQMPWNSLSPEFIALGERLIYRSIEAEQIDQTQQLLSLFYQNLPEQEFAEMAFRVADALRTQGEHKLAGQVYGSLAQSTDPVLRQNSLLWAGYSLAVSGDAEGARKILDQVSELHRGDDNFLTYCLAQGRVNYADNNIRDGLRSLSRAMVLTSVDATFKPELYYLLTVGYQQSGNAEAADRLAREFAIFYPDNLWLKKYQSEVGSTL
jgi:hypothetical protein